MLAAGEREAVAYHEAGHVLCAELCPTVDKTLHATINPRGRAAGFADRRPLRSRAAHRAAHPRAAHLHPGRPRRRARDLRHRVLGRRQRPREGQRASPAPRSSSTASPPPSARSSAPRPGSPSRRRRPPTARCAGSSRTPTATRSRWSRSTASSSSASPSALLAAGDIDHLEIAAAMEGSTRRRAPPEPAAAARTRARRRADVDEEPAPHPRRRLWVPGPSRRRLRDRRVPRRARPRTPVDLARESAGFPQAPRLSRT